MNELSICLKNHEFGYVEIYVQIRYLKPDIFTNIWQRPNPISWQSENNKIHLYYPDFYLPKYDIYLDPKNPYCMVKDEYKIKQIKKKIDLICGDLKIIENYIENVV